MFFCHIPARVAEHHAGKRPVDHHLSEVVRIPTSSEEPVRDETTAGAKNEILLDIGGMMKPVADNEAGEGNAKVVGKGLKLSSSWLISLSAWRVILSYENTL